MSGVNDIRANFLGYFAEVRELCDPGNPGRNFRIQRGPGGKRRGKH